MLNWKEAARHYRRLYSEAVERGCRDRDFWRGRTFAVEREGAEHRREMKTEIDRLRAGLVTHGAHTGMCGTGDGPYGYVCVCGLYDLIDAREHMATFEEGRELLAAHPAE